jgi:hypothetical protein
MTNKKALIQNRVTCKTIKKQNLFLQVTKLVDLKVLCNFARTILLGDTFS